MASAMSLIYAVRCGVPKVLLARMGLNILINEVIGIIPGVGDAFSFWFKSNKRNYALLQRYWAAPPPQRRQARRSDWVFVSGMIALLVLIVIAGIAVSVFALREAAQFFRHP